jgi:prepilin-type N-terminal cleavage/methylation domain-containing protein
VRGKRAGFTLVEVIVVLVILAILAAIAIPALTGYIDKAGYASFKADAREMTMAYQTLISEAYADPSSHFPVSSDEGELFIGGHKIASVYIDSEHDGSLYYINLTGDQEDPSANPLSGYGRLSALTKVSPYPEMPPGAWDHINFPFSLWCNSRGQIVAFIYIDPKSYDLTEYPVSYAVRAEGIYYTYNLTMYNWSSGRYDPNAGYQLCKVYDNQSTGETKITPL